MENNSQKSRPVVVKRVPARLNLREARKFFGAPRIALADFAAYFAPWRPEEAQTRFLSRFAELDA